MKEALGLEKLGIKVLGFADANAAAITGERIDMQKFKRVTFLVMAVAGTTILDHTVSFQQHTVASGGSPLALALASPYFHKIDAATVFTRVDPVAAAASFDLLSLLGDTKFVVAFEVLSEELAAGYRWASLNLGDSGAAQFTQILAVGHNPVDGPVYTQAL